MHYDSPSLVQFNFIAVLKMYESIMKSHLASLSFEKLMVCKRLLARLRRCSFSSGKGDGRTPLTGNARFREGDSPLSCVTEVNAVSVAVLLLKGLLGARVSAV